MLYRPEAFEPPTAAPWREHDVRDRIRAIVTDAEATYSPDSFWPADDWDGWSAPLPLMSLYVGAAGVLWALDALRRRGYADGALDHGDAARRLVARWREQPDFIQAEGFELPEPREAAFLAGGSGVLLVAWRLAPSDELADDLHARAMHEWTGDARWADAWRECADALLARRDAEGLWTIRLYGHSYRGLTPPHGLVGNVGALLDGGPLLADDVRERLMSETARVVERTAVVEDG